MGEENPLTVYIELSIELDKYVDLLKAIMAARSPKQSWKDVDGVDVLPPQEVKKYLRWVRNRALEPRKPLQPGVSLAATRWRRRRHTGTLFCNSSEVFSGI